jgi:hypothetical protein
MTRSRALPRLALAALVALTPCTALAQATSAAAAEKLFQEGRVLMADGRYVDACPKLAESSRLDPAVGTSLNLAECYEHLDKIASAWVTYKKAETMARRANQQERYTHAAARAQALEGRLSTLTLSVGAPPKGLTITRDGERVGEAAWSTAVPVDGGVHVIEASAPGRRVWKREVTIAPSAARVKVEIPELPAAALDAPPAEGPPTAEAFPLQRTVGWVAVATGAAAIGTGFAFGAIARSKYDDSGAHCSAVDCDARGVALIQDARSAALVSTVLVVAGGAVAAGGVVLVLVTPKRERAARVGLSLSPAAAGVWGTF